MPRAAMPSASSRSGDTNMKKSGRPDIGRFEIVVQNAERGFGSHTGHGKQQIEHGKFFRRQKTEKVKCVFPDMGMDMNGNRLTFLKSQANAVGDIDHVPHAVDIHDNRIHSVFACDSTGKEGYHCPIKE